MERDQTNGHKELKNKYNFTKKSLANLNREELKILCKIIAVRKENFFINMFRFIPVLDKSSYHNMKETLGNRKAPEYFNECSNVAFYDLTKNQNP